MRHRIGVIPGGGIGPETVSAAIAVMHAAGVDFDEVRFDLGADRYKRDGHVLSEEDVDNLRGCDAILKGPIGPAIGDTAVPPGIVERGIILRLRTELDLYISVRPFSGRGADFVIVRENSEGAYAGEGGFLRRGTAAEVATQPARPKEPRSSRQQHRTGRPVTVAGRGARPVGNGRGCDPRQQPRVSIASDRPTRT